VVTQWLRINRFRRGFVAYLGERTVAFGDEMDALP